MVPWFDDSWSVPRPVRSDVPSRVAILLGGRGVRFAVVGSAATGHPARDLDILVPTDPDSLMNLGLALEEIAVGEWRATLARLSRGEPGPVTIRTVMGPIDIWPDADEEDSDG
jgi:hypothetical protein